MAATPRVVHRLRGRTSALDLDTEGGRAFLQERVAFFNKVAFWISGSFFVAAGLAGPYYGDPSPPLLHAATLVVSLTAWQVCGRGPALSTGVLEVIDAAAVALVLVGFAAQALLVPPAFAGEVTRSLVLILTQMVIVRAVLVPSPAARTAGLSLLAALPTLAVILRLPPPPAPTRSCPGTIASGPPLWTASAVVVAALVSHVIYGLRAEIQQARRLGQYTLEEKLGEGGMGSVYRARHAMLRRPTAIKLAPPEKSSEAALARFEREVQLTASLSHPNTVSVFDYGRTPDGIFYYAMEYLEGTDLDAARAGGRSPAPGARRPRAPAGRLRAGRGPRDRAHPPRHQAREHHPLRARRDPRRRQGGRLRPGPGPRARLGGEADPGQRDPGHAALPLAGGDPSPDAVDARSDLYGLGAVGYYLLTGTHVFGGATTVEVCSHHLHTRPVPPSERLGHPLPAALERLVLACLEKEPAQRPGSAAELRDALGDLDDVGRWSESEARAWWERWRRGRGERPRDVTVRPTRTLDVDFDQRGEG